MKPWPKTDSQVDTSRRKFARPELAYELGKGRQMDSQVVSQVHSSRKKSQIPRIYRLLAINLCRLALGGQTVKNLRRLAYKFELHQSQHTSSQIHASGWPNETQGERKSKTCIDARVRLDSVLMHELQINPFIPQSCVISSAATPNKQW